MGHDVIGWSKWSRWWVWLPLWLALLLRMGAPAQEQVFRAYQQNEGLKNLAATTIVADRDGFLWVATENGVYRFDGEKFEQMGRERGLSTVNITQVFADGAGRLWVVTRDNLYRWDGLQFQQAVAGRALLPGGDYRIAAEDIRSLLVLDHRRLQRLVLDADGRVTAVKNVFSARLERLHPELTQLTGVGVTSGETATIWMTALRSTQLLSVSSQPVEIDSESVLRFWGASNGVEGDQWRQIMSNSQGAVWVAGLRRVLRRAPNSDRFEDTHAPDMDPAEIEGHAPLVEAPDGQMVIPIKGGVAIWDRAQWRMVGAAQGLMAQSAIRGLAFDTDGALWIASQGAGVLRWPGFGRWQAWTTRQSLPSSSVWSMFDAGNGAMWVGTETGLAEIDLATGAARTLRGGWGFGIPNVLEKAGRGVLLVATLPGEIVRHDIASGRNQRLGKLAGFVRKGFHGASGELYLATEVGLQRVTAEQTACPSRLRLPTG